MAKISVSLSRSGQPCISEIGGGFDDHGKATIISDMFFNPKIPIFIRNNPKKCGEVAIFKIRKGDHIITTDINSNEDVVTKIYQVKEFSLNLTGSNSYATMDRVATYQQGGWDKPEEVTDEMIRLAQVSKGKASCFDCTHIHFYKQDQSVIED